MELVSFAQELHRLPREGGLLDQDSYFVHLMRETLAFQQQKRDLDHRRNSANPPKGR